MARVTAQMFRLEFSRLHWLARGPEEADLCAHGHALVQIGDELLVRPTEDDGWSLSASSLYLLRTLRRDHRPSSSVAEHLLPCCGFSMWPGDGDEVLIIGCPNGVDWQVEHTPGGVTLTSSQGSSATLPSTEWRGAVIRVADQVRAFYDASLPKRLPEDDYDRRGYEQFWQEWMRLRTAA